MNFTLRTSMVLSAIVLAVAACDRTEQATTGSPVSGKTTDKSNPSNEKSAALTPNWPNQKACGSAPNKDPTDCYYYIDSSQITGDSYCLRKTKNHAVHVREATSRDSLLTFGTDGAAWFEAGNSGGAKCIQYAMDIAAVGDRFTIEKSGAFNLKLSMFDSTSVPPYSKLKFSVDLQPDPLDDNGKHFYWWGTDNNIDYFVLLADDKHGKMNDSDTAGVPKIQQYYEIEAFNRGESNPACLDRRPDKGASSTSIPQASPWVSGTHTCTYDPSDQENGSGSGGHDYP